MHKGPRDIYALLMAKEPDVEQYTPRGAKIPIPERGEFRRNLDKLMKAPAPSKKVGHAPATRKTSEGSEE
jgi:hypothetical protein